MIRPDKHQDLIQLGPDEMMARLKDLRIRVCTASEPIQLHILRQIHIPPSGILPVNRGNHHAGAHHKLVL